MSTRNLAAFARTMRQLWELMLHCKGNV